MDMQMSELDGITAAKPNPRLVRVRTRRAEHPRDSPNVLVANAKSTCGWYEQLSHQADPTRCAECCDSLLTQSSALICRLL